jgi:hypothetical protein
MKNSFFDVRKLPVEGFLDNFISNDSESFVHSKYAQGRPNNSPASTAGGVQLAIERILPEQDDNALFGVHIKETINQFRSLFGKK